MDRLSQSAEEASFNAWPALKEIFYDGWLIRLAGGESRRTNSVSVIGRPSHPLPDKLAFCERIYRSHQLPVSFRVRSLDGPALERHLAEEGFSAHDETLTLFLDLSCGAPHRVVPGFRIEARPSPRWLQAHQCFTGRSQRQTRLRARQLDLIALPSAFASLSCDRQIVSVAYGVVHDRIMSLQWVATHPLHRQQGFSRATLAGLFAWGVAQGAVGTCLQVLASNTPARALYRSLGFDRELYRYHFRVRE
ncbi:MAG: GNAT family N-acetyltransferase [Alphaproteobacteria bacterium]|nr:GNAT family N-acetyltransferase [Alphaproteobacteria bacterium]